MDVTMSVQTENPEIYFAGQISPEHVKMAREQGISTIICNRPDAEGGTPSHVIRQEAETHDVEFHYLPMVHGAPIEDLVGHFATAVKTATGPILAYCASGARSSMLWNHARSA